MIQNRPIRLLLPAAIFAVLLAAWVSIGIWAIGNAPFASGTDESINYVAFAAAKNRWATEDDFRRWGIDYFYYPPLYFLCFAPFYGDDPNFVENYPRGDREDRNYLIKSGRTVISGAYLSRVPASLDRLYRQAKSFSLALGLIVLLSLAAVLRLLFPGPGRWWLALLGTAPLICLPQFLYYHILCNNDSLVNALGAVTALFFVVAMLSLEQGRRGRFLSFSVLAAASVGLAILTKMSGPVLLPYLAGLAIAHFAADPGRTTAIRARRSVTFGAMLGAVAVLAGGWWIIYKWGQGDWNSFKAHQLAHPWAAVADISPTDIGWALEQVWSIARSYYALFTGLLFISIPDLVLMAWLLVPASGLAAAVIPRPPAAGSLKTAQGAAPLRKILWLTLAAAAAFNFVLVFSNLFLGFEGAYGRLLFPTAVAWHALWAACIARVFKRCTGFLVPGGLLMVAFLASLFSWTFIHRMATAVSQPPEDVRTILYSGKRVSFGPVWDYSYAQPVSFPAGELAALRMEVIRTSMVPQVGATMRGTVRLRKRDGGEEVIPLRRTSLGDWDYCRRWIELELERAVTLVDRTDAIVSLEASPPRWLRSVVKFNYALALDRKYEDVSAARISVMPENLSLCIAAVYRPSPSPGKGSLLP